MIAHLTGQERALEPFGWTGRQAEWIALACLPIEPETVGSFEALGIERRILPIRVYRGDARNTRRYFPLKLPIALKAERAVFVFVDPGYQSAKALRS